MEQTPKGAARSAERVRPEVDVPWKVGVAGPEANPARSDSEAPGRLWGARTGRFTGPQPGLKSPIRAVDDHSFIANARR